MKNKFLKFASAALFSLAFSITAFAATGKISFSDPSAALGSEVNVTMKVASADGTLSTADVTVAYDAKLLEFVSGTDADGGAGTVRVHGASNGAGSGTLEYNLKFKTLAAGTATITIGTQEVYDADNQIVDIQHEGTSTIKIAAPASASKDASLSALTVSPGSLTPAFSPEVTEYAVTVGTDVDVLAVNATPADDGASFSLSGNEGLQLGDNTVQVKVTAADGTTSASYTLHVTKEEGGPSAGDAEQPSETVNEGVRLSAREKTITIMNPGSDVEIPEGFAESSINIDGHQVRGWVWKADSDPQYCIVYGMNDAGELNFYRYDLVEKTLQRYFRDPIEEEQQANAEKYPALVADYDQLVARYNAQFLIMCGLGVVALVLVIVIIVLLLRMKRIKGTRPQQAASAAPKGGRRRQDGEDTMELGAASGAYPSLSKEEEDLGVTQVLPQRSGHRGAVGDPADGSVHGRGEAETADVWPETVPDETVVIPRAGGTVRQAEQQPDAAMDETVIIPRADAAARKAGRQSGTAPDETVVIPRVAGSTADAAMDETIVIPNLGAQRAGQVQTENEPEELEIEELDADDDGAGSAAEEGREAPAETSEEPPLPETPEKDEGSDKNSSDSGLEIEEL